MSPSGSPLLPVSALLAAMFSIQFGAGLAKGLFPLLGPAGTTGLRVGLAALLLMVLFRPLKGLTREKWLAAAPYGAVLGAMNLSFYLALATVPLGVAVTLEFLGPLLLSAALLYRQGQRAALLWPALALGGVLMLTQPWAGATDPLGAGLALLAGAFWAAYIVLGGRMARLMPPGQGVALGMLFAAAVTLPFALWQAGTALLSPAVLLVGLGIAVLSSALPYALELFSLRVLPATVFGVLMSLEPAIASLSGMVVLRELLLPAQWLGVAVVVFASAGVVWMSVRQGRA